MSATQIKELLKQLARAEIDAQSEQVKALELEQKKLAKQIKDIKSKPDEIKQAIRDLVTSHIAETGELKAPEAVKDYITIKRVNRVVYDETEALEYAQANGLEDCLRVALNKTRFNAMLKTTLKDWAGAETVTNFEIAISKAGDLLIFEDKE